MTQDEDQVRLLSIFHYVVGGLVGLFALLPIFHLIFGLVMILAPEKFAGKGEPPPVFIGWMLVIFAAVFITVGWALAGFVLAAGHFLARRKRYLFCLVVAGVECLFTPIGTVLGVFTIIVLMRESVKQMFAAGNPVEAKSVLPGDHGTP
ncbi:MAG: hypothetical protein NTW21_06985 [Verrucomicrobia bacterium]|nr:hypothetical protein [Verrucomicrobiota bacterium]